MIFFREKWLTISTKIAMTQEEPIYKKSNDERYAGACFFFSRSIQKCDKHFGLWVWFGEWCEKSMPKIVDCAIHILYCV